MSGNETTQTISRKKMLLALVGMALVLAAAWLIRGSVLYERTDDAQVDGRVMPLSAQITGQVQQVAVVEGQLVHAGDVLAVIDQRNYRVAVLQALANLAYAQNAAATSYFNAAITISRAYSGQYAAQATLKIASVELDVAEHKLHADEEMLKPPEVDVCTRELVVATDQQMVLRSRAKLAEAMTNLRNAQTAPQQVSLANAEAHAADSRVMQRKAQLAQAELNLSYTIIRSPVRGIVGRRILEIGQSVRVGQDVIDIVSLDDVGITANFKETQLAHLSPGQPVEIKLDAYGGTWKGHVTNLGGRADSVFSFTPPKVEIGGLLKDLQRVPVRIDFDRPEDRSFNTGGLLKPGLSAESEVTVRWLPRVRAPNRLPGGRAQAPTLMALWDLQRSTRR
jgi:membrane fusion protein (multidrug efflux system)